MNSFLTLSSLRASLFALLLVLFGSNAAKGQILVNDNQTAAQLVQTLVGGGIAYTNATLNCAPGAYARFTTVSSNLGLDSGIILTSGRAKTGPLGAGADGAQNTYFAATGNNYPGDGELAQLGGIQTFDACILEFDFVPDGDSLLFEYVFGSEEYDAFSCSGFNDVFGFFLSGPFFPNANIAKIPGTNIPVSINSTTDPLITMPGSLGPCIAMGPGSPFAQYYNNNAQGTSITYYGMTKVLTARANVSPCSTYHIKLAIADGGDGTLDSGVFLAANSFRSNNIILTLESELGGGYPYVVEGCIEGTIRAKRPAGLNYPQTIKLGYGGSATRNVDFFNVPDSVVIAANDTTSTFTITGIQDNITEGDEYIAIYTLNACTLVPIDSIIIPLREYLPVAVLNNDTTVCGSLRIQLHATGDNNFTYQWTANPPLGADIETPTDSLTYVNADSTTTFTVVAVYKSCPSDTDEVTLFIEPVPVVNIITADTVVCLSDSMVLTTNVGPSYFTRYQYSWSPADYLSDPSVKEPKFFTQEFLDHKYVLTVTTPLGCTGSDSIGIHTRPPLELVNITEDLVLKYGDSVRLNADGALFYTWTPTTFLSNANVNNPYAFPVDPTVFIVYGINVYGCRDTGYVKVGIDYTMDEFFPTAFSPNGDGLNDVFRIRDLKFRTLQEFRIYNRYGQEVFSTTDPARGWDGTFNGKPVDPGVFHFMIRVGRPDGTVRRYKGDVTLLR